VYLSVFYDATIVGSHDSRDYPLDGASWALIFARAQDNIGIVGNLPILSHSSDTPPRAAAPYAGGTINGDYAAYIDHYDPGKHKLSLYFGSKTAGYCCA
jgi:hypothetical protein